MMKRTKFNDFLYVYAWPLHQIILAIPIISVFPIPFAMPLIVIGIVISQPEEWPLIPLYFGWLAFGIFFLIRMEKYQKKHGVYN